VAIAQVIYCIQTQLSFENFIFQTSQTPAVGKTIKPYQGLKHAKCRQPNPVDGFELKKP
jgi:hypothetical protein